MRYREFKLTEDELLEIKMSPSNLQKMAANIDAQVGMEFELIIPNYYDNDDDEIESEIDRDADESISTGAGWRRDLTSFFRGGDNPNPTSAINYVIEALDEEYWSWIGEKWDDAVNDDPDIYSEIYEIMKKDFLTQGDDESDEEFEERAQGIANNGEREWDEAKDYVREQWESEGDRFEEFLEDMDYNTYWDIYDAYSGRLDWPYWYYNDRAGDGANVDTVASDFEDAIGKPVIASSSYHGATRKPGHYVVEPDGSLSGDDGESGLEFVSPPQSIAEMLADIDKIAKWAGRIGAYTNESTGLHMNVSVPNQQNLDYVKLAMFLGDEYILEQFGREGNTYCKSALKKIKMTARNDPSRVAEMMRQFQSGLNQLASKVLHTGSTEKYTSINNRGKWIEFRGPGGNWLDGPADIKRVKDTLLRAVVALDVATKPDEYKQEYYKKLYKTLSQGSEDDTIQYFAKYAAGELPKQALKSFVRQIQQKRQVGKLKADGSTMYWWTVALDGGRVQPEIADRRTEVAAKTELEAKERALRQWGLSTDRYLDYVEAVISRPHEDQLGDLDTPFVWKVIGSSDSPYQSRGTEVVATSAEQAKARAVAKWNLNLSGRSVEEFTAGWRAIPQRPASDEEIASAAANEPSNTPMPRRTYWVYVEGDYERGLSVQATSEYAARQIASMDRPGIFASVPFADIKVEIMQPTSSRDQEFSGIWEVVSRVTDDVVYRFSAEEAHMYDPRSVGEAERVAASWRQRNNFDDAVYVRPMMRGAQPAAGSTQDLQRQRLAAQMPAPDFEDGNWEVYSIASNNPIYRFIANTEEEAVRAFHIWQDAIRNPGMPREGFNLRAVAGAAPRTPPANQSFRVTYTGTDGRTNNITVTAANANAAMDYVRRQLDATGYNIRNIEAEPVAGEQAAAATQAPRNQRWRVLDRDNQEVYSFINTTAQSDANAAALRWITTLASPAVRERGPFEVVPSITR